MKSVPATHEHSNGIGFMIAVLFVVMLPVLVGTGVAGKVTSLVLPNHTATNTFAGNPPYTPPKSTRESIPNGTYAGWTQYHHLELGFAVNIPTGLYADELPQTRAQAPQYPEFVLQIYSKQNGVEDEFARVTVYDTDLDTNEQAQEHSTDPLFSSTPTKQTGSLVGHKSVQYFYQDNIRTVVYLVQDGNRTFEIRGSIDATDSTAVANYWATFNSLLKSFSID